MFGHISRRTAIFTAKSKPLDQAHHDQHDRRCYADGCIGRQKPNDECRQAHQTHRDQKSIFTSDHIADPAKEYRAERPNGKTSSKRRQRKNKAGRLVYARKKLGGNNRGQQAVKVEIIPFKNRPKRRCDDDMLFALRRCMVLG